MSSNNGDDLEVDLSKKKIWGRNDIIGFGTKHKGEVVDDIMKTLEGCKYLIWCADYVDFFELDEDLLLECQDKVEEARAERGPHRFRDDQDFSW